MRTIIFAALAAAAMATSAAAVTTVTSVAGPDNTTAQNILFNFNGAAPAGLTGNFSITTGTSAQKAAAPLGDVTPYLVIPGQGAAGTATLNLGGSFTNISFYWGSIDSYNKVTFFTGANGTGTNLGSFAGSAIPGATADGQQQNAANNRRVFFNFGGPTASSVVFDSTNIAFELDDVATAAVPEPAVWATMMAGFGLVGFSLRRRRPTTVSA